MCFHIFEIEMKRRSYFSIDFVTLKGKSTPATFETGYLGGVNTGYPDTGYPTLTTPDLLPLENGKQNTPLGPCVMWPADY